MTVTAIQVHIFGERLEAHEAEHPGYIELWNEFSAMLLSHGGNLVVVTPWPEILLPALVEKGQLFEPKEVVFDIGAPSRCYDNSEAVALKLGIHIGWGFALSEDGLWRNHGWAFDPDTGILTETTCERLMYHGISVPASLMAAS